jgi:ribosomal protein S12
MFGYDGPLREVEESGDIFTLVSRPTRNGFLEHIAKVARRRHQFAETGWLVTALKEAAASCAWVKCDDAILVRVRTVTASKTDDAIRKAVRARAPWVGQL